MVRLAFGTQAPLTSLSCLTPTVVQYIRALASLALQSSSMPSFISKTISEGDYICICMRVCIYMYVYEYMYMYMYVHGPGSL